MPKARVLVNGEYYEVGGLSSGERQSILDDASTYANGLRNEMSEEISELTRVVGETDTYIDGAFKDGIISEVEARTIKAYLKTIEAKKTEMDREYQDIYGNLYTSDLSKASLSAAKLNYDEAFAYLVNDIYTAIEDGLGTEAEGLLIDQRFLDYNQSIYLLVGALNSAIDQIANAKDTETAFNMSEHVAGQISPINTKILTMESEISQSAEEILLRVTKTELETTMGTVQQTAIDEANAYADGLKLISDGAIDDLQDQLTATDTYIDGAFKDSIITVLEASGISTYLNNLNTAKTTFDTTYTELYGNLYLKNTFKSNLLLAKGNLDSSHTNLVNAINIAISDSTATPEESLDVDSKFQTYSDSVAVYSLRVDQAIDSIAKEKALEAQANAEGYTDGVLVPIQATLVEHGSSITQIAEEIELKVTQEEFDAGIASSNTYADDLKVAIDADIDLVQQSVTDTNTYVNEAFRDGIIYEAEYRKIQAFLLTLSESKNAMDSRYTSIYTNASLTGTPKTNLSTAKTTYDTRYTQLVDTINAAIADQLADATESENVNIAFVNYNNSIALLSTSMETAVDAIAKAKSDKALADAKVYSDEAKAELNILIGDLDSDMKATDGYINTAFKDGVVSAEEAKRITGYLNIIDTSKGAFEQKYVEIYNNTSLGSTYKSELLTAKNAYNTKYSNLITSINTAIADGKSTIAEANDVDIKFKEYNVASDTLTTKLEKALDNITKNKADKALSDATNLITPVDNRLRTAEATIVTHAEDIQLRVTSQEFDALEGRVDTAEASLVIFDNQIEAKVSQTTFDALEVGGRNLLRDSGVPVTNSSYMMKQYSFGSSIPLQGELYTVTVKFTAGSDRTSLYLYTSGGYSNPGGVNFSNGEKDANGIVSKTFIMNYTAGRTPAEGFNHIQMYQMPNTGTSSSTIEWLKLEKGNKATDWTPAPEDTNAAIALAEQNAKQYSDGLKTAIDAEISDLDDALGALDTEIKGTFKDGIITQAEAISIGKYKNSLIAEKADTDARYTTVYGDVELTGATKTALSTKKTAHDTAHTNLINSINTAIADGKTTTVESADVDTKFGLYRTALGELATAFENAIDTIAQAKATKALTDANAFTQGKIDTANQSITDVNTRVTNLNTYVDGAFEDGVIEQAEAKAIQKYINSINNEKTDVDARYTSIYADTSLVGTPKTNLLNAKTAYNTAHSNLITSINTAITDGKTTVAEKTDVDTKFASFSTASTTLSTRFEEAIRAIENAKIDAVVIGGRNYYRKSTVVSPTVNSPIVAKNPVTAPNGFRVTGQQNLPGVIRIPSIITSNGWWTVSFWGMANGASTVQMDICDLGATSINFTTTWTKLQFSVNVTNYTAAVYNFVDMEAIGWINYDLKDFKVEKGNKATDWSPAPEDVDEAIAGLAQDILDVDGALEDLDVEIKGTFKDGVISESEAKSIEKYNNSLNTEKLDVDSRYTTIYADALLTGTPKTNLLNAKNAYNTAHANLLTSISTAISDGKTTTAEKADVDTKFGLYKTALGTLSTRFEEAINAIALAKVNALKTGEIDPLKGRMTTAEGTITTQATQIALRVTKTEFDAVQVGGRNLFMKSNVAEYGTQSWGISSPTVVDSVNTYEGRKSLKLTPTSTSGISSVSHVIAGGASYTWSFMVKSTESFVPGGSKLLHMQLHDSSGAHAELNMKYFPSTVPANVWTKIYVTFDTPTALVTYPWNGYIWYLTSGHTYYVTDFNLERGNKPTDWSPAVEDLATRVSTAEGSITTNANNIALKVSQTDFNGNTIASLINQSATTIDILASKINLVGAVTVLSDITGNLGTITTGKINALQIDGGVSNQIYFGPSKTNFDGRIDYEGNSFRFQRDSSTYYKVNTGGANGWDSADHRFLHQFYAGGFPIFNFGFSDDGSVAHRTMQAGEVRLKFLNGVTQGLQIRQGDDSDYSDLYARDVHVIGKGKALGTGQVASGSVTITPVANTATSIWVSFGKTFASAPTVVATANTTVPGIVEEVSVSGANTTGFYAWVYRVSASNTSINWQASEDV